MQVQILMILAALGAVPIAVGVFLLLRRHRLVSTERVAIADARPGFAKLHGTIEDGASTEELLAPFSKARCVCYRFAVEALEVVRGRRRWWTVQDGARSVDFLVRDPSGSVLVKPLGASLRFPEEPRASSGEFIEPSEELRSFLASVEARVGGMWSGKGTMRVEERTLAAGDELFLLGMLRPAAAWEVERSGASVVLTEGGDEFLISTVEDAAVSRKLLWQGLACFAAGLSFWVAVVVLASLAASSAR